MRPAAWAAVTAALVAMVCPGRVWAWGDDAHDLVTEEAVRRLPEPLRGLLSEPDTLNRLKAAARAPDERRAEEKKQEASLPPDADYTPAEKPRHFLDIDFDPKRFPPPYDTFPRSLAKARELIGKSELAKIGTGPWAVDEELEAALGGMTGRDLQTFLSHAGSMIHYAADLHQPFHTTVNYNGQLTGNDGIHFVVDVGLVKWFPDFYAEAVRQGRRMDRCLGAPGEPKVVDAAFQWVIAANGRVAPILEADTAARKAADGYDPGAEANWSDIDDPGTARAEPYYAALKRGLDQRGNPVAAGLADAAGDAADLLYTVWVRAGKPATLMPAAEEAPPGPPVPAWLIAVGVGIALALLIARRRSRPLPPPKP